MITNYVCSSENLKLNLKMKYNYFQILIKVMNIICLSGLPCFIWQVEKQRCQTVGNLAFSTACCTYLLQILFVCCLSSSY